MHWIHIAAHNSRSVPCDVLAARIKNALAQHDAAITKPPNNWGVGRSHHLSSEWGYSETLVIVRICIIDDQLPNAPDMATVSELVQECAAGAFSGSTISIRHSLATIQKAGRSVEIVT